MLQATSSEVAPASNDTVLGASKEEYRRMKAWLDDRVDASKKKPLAEVVTITPLLARLLLASNGGNRPISLRNANDLASDIANKRWEFNGESIVVAKTGVLIDGQHRCLQVVATNRSIETVIVFGPREQARFTIDTGRSKTVANFLAMKGKTYTHALGPAVGHYLVWQQFGYIPHTGDKGKQRPTKAQVLEAADELGGFGASVDATAACMKTIRGHAVLSFCHYVFWKKAGKTAADEFMRKLIEGDGLKKGDPILYCRNRLLGLGRGTLTNARADVIFKCWNAWRSGLRVDHVKISNDRLPKVEK